MANESGPNKRLNGPDGRVRNTSTSNAARVPGVPNKVGTPTVPNFGASYGEVPGATGALASAYGGFQFVAAAMRQQRIGLKAGLKPAVAGIQAAGVSAASEVTNTAIDRGVLGASDVSQQLIGVQAGVKTDVEAARQDVRNQILQSKVTEQQAFMDYQITQQQMAMQAEAARQQAALQAQAIAAQEASSAAMLAAVKGMRDEGRVQLTPGTSYTDPQSGVVVDLTREITGAPNPGQALQRAIDAAIAQKNQREQYISGRIASGRM